MGWGRVAVRMSEDCRLHVCIYAVHAMHCGLHGVWGWASHHSFRVRLGRLGKGHPCAYCALALCPLCPLCARTVPIVPTVCSHCAHCAGKREKELAAVGRAGAVCMCGGLLSVQDYGSLWVYWQLMVRYRLS